MPVNTPKKSEEAKSKNDPNGSSHQRVDKPPEPPLEQKQPAPDSEVSSLRKTHKSSQGSAKEEPSELPSQLMQQTMKPESEDSSSSSSSSSSSESSDEEVPLKEKMKELPPPPPLKRRDKFQSPLHSRGKNLKS